MPAEFPPIENIVRNLQNLNPYQDEIPEPTNCYCCAQPTHRATVDYSYEFRVGQDISIEVRKSMPGYRCSAGIDFLDHGMSQRFLRVVADEMATAGDDSLQRSLNGELPSNVTLSPIPKEVQDFLDSNPIG